MTTTLRLSGVPFPLEASDGSSWNAEEDATSLSVRALPKSDIFIDPRGGTQMDAPAVLNAVTLLGTPPHGDFQFSARARVEFAATFDAAVLMVWISEKYWAKICFEYSPQKEPMVVTVVSRVVADDSNAFLVDGDHVWLRISKIDGALAFHSSADGLVWTLVRFFALDGPGTARIGFEAQSPLGEGCSVTFDEIKFSSDRLADLRTGV